MPSLFTKNVPQNQLSRELSAAGQVQGGEQECGGEQVNEGVFPRDGGGEHYARVISGVFLCDDDEGYAAGRKSKEAHRERVE